MYTVHVAYQVWEFNPDNEYEWLLTCLTIFLQLYVDVLYWMFVFFSLVCGDIFKRFTKKLAKSVESNFKVQWRDNRDFS